MNTPSSEDERLRSILRGGVTPLPDDGFSTRVMAALPSQNHGLMLYARAAVCGLGALVGLVFAWQRGVSFDSVKVAANQLSDSFVQAGGGLADYRFVVAVAVTGLSLLYVFKEGLRKTFRI